VLARLDEIEGVHESRVDWSGTRFLLILSPGADEERVAGAARQALGPGTAVLDRKREHEAVEAFHRGESWMRAGETLHLSHEEARVLGERFAHQAADELGLTREQTARLSTILGAACAKRFEGLHESGRPPTATRLEMDIGGVIDDCRSFLSPEQIEGLRSFLLKVGGG